MRLSAVVAVFLTGVLGGGIAGAGIRIGARCNLSYSYCEGNCVYACNASCVITVVNSTKIPTLPSRAALLLI